MNLPDRRFFKIKWFGGPSNSSPGGCRLTTLKEFEEALRDQGLNMALAVLERLRERDRSTRSIAPARRVSGRKMTPELAQSILDLHATTNMTQQEIAFQLGVNQGRVNEVIKRRKWLSGDPAAPEAVARDKAMERVAKTSGGRARATPRSRNAPDARGAVAPAAPKGGKGGKAKGRVDQGQLALGDL
jgi:hypothetical protein